MHTPFICFIHIERAGGTSLHHLLRNNYLSYISLKPHYTWTNEPNAFFKKNQLKMLKTFFPFIKGIGGHTTRSYAGYEEVLKGDIFYFTFVREPISRYLSHFNYQRNIKDINWTIEEYINESRFNNFQTIRIAGKPSVIDAKKALSEHIQFVGITEKFNESLIILKHKLSDSKFDIFYEKKNESLIRKKNYSFNDFNKEIQDKIIANNALDIELYNFVSKKIYPSYIKSFKGDLKKEIEVFNKKNKHYNYSFPKQIIYYVIKGFTRFVFEPLVYKFEVKI